MIDKSYDEFGSKTQDSDSRVGLKTENTDSQVGLLPLKFPARTHESGSDTLNKIYSERLSPTQPVSPGTQPVATLLVSVSSDPLSGYSAQDPRKVGLSAKRRIPGDM